MVCDRTGGLTVDPENLSKIISLRHELHRHPNLSLCEGETIGLLQDFLRRNTAFEIFDRDGWFYAVRRGTSGKAPVAFRSELDALPMEEGIDLPYASVNPGAAHKCGHEGQMAALCGLALEAERQHLNRTVFLIFQPAEEIGAGAVRCKDLIREKGIGEIYAFHNFSGYPEKSIIFRRGLAQPASEGLMIRLQGRQSHASAPEEGINPSTAIAKLALYAQDLPDEPHAGMALCTIVGMKCGEGDFGISAGEGSVSFTLRAEDESVMKEMEIRLLNEAESLAAAEGLKMTYEIRDYFPETRNHEAALDKVLRAAETIGAETIEMRQLWRASEDFGHFLKECSGAIFYIGNGEHYPALHTLPYDFNDSILSTAVDMFTELIRL